VAETDSTRPSVQGEPHPDGEGTTPKVEGSGQEGATGTSPDDAPRTSGVAQRHTLPLRRASTLPDLSGVPDDDAPAGGAHPATDTAHRSEGPDVHASGGVSADASDATTQDTTRHATGEAVLDGTADGRADETTESSANGTTDEDAQQAATEASAPATGQESDGRSQHSHDMTGVAWFAAGSSAVAGASGSGATAAPTPGGRPSGSSPGSPDSTGSTAGADAGRDDHHRTELSTDTGALSVRPPDKDVARRAAVRDQAVTAKPALARFLQVVVALFFPVIVVAAAVRAVATSSFLWLEYHRPGFPADQFGFSLDDRMTYGSYALDYVLNFAPPRYLGGLVTPEGEPLFLASEVGHMADVKGVLGLSFFIALVLFVLAVLACVYLARRYKGGIRRALFSGAVLTLVAIIALTVLAVIGWQTFFTQVHALFFADGTWTFRVDDTLIRLFPEQFWTDSAITIAVLVLGATLVTLVATWPTRARRERSMLAQEAAQARYREALEAS
jgi:integral membrane protein (TIGR01906 family)